MAELSIPLDKIDPHPLNPRDDAEDTDLGGLAGSIAMQGVHEPVVVFPHPRQPGRYVLLMGERRWRAARLAGLDEIPARVRKAPRNNGEALLAMLTENWQRQDVNPIQKAHALARCLKETPGLTQAKLAIRLGVHAGTVSYHLSLLDLDEESQQRVIDGTVTAGRAHQAVTAARSNRPRNGPTAKGTQRKVKVSGWHFTMRHPLAPAVSSRCVGNHPDRPKYGKVGCGQCWEDVIRESALADEGLLPTEPADPRLTLAEATAPVFQPPPSLGGTNA